MTCHYCKTTEACKGHECCLGVDGHQDHPIVACQCAHCVKAFFQRHHDADIQDFLRRK